MESKKPIRQEQPAKPAKAGRPRSESPVGDVTRTARSARHQVRLAEAKGKRVVVDAPAPVVEAMEGLLALGYGATQKEVFCNAVMEVSALRGKKSL